MLYCNIRFEHQLIENVTRSAALHATRLSRKLRNKNTQHYRKSVPPLWDTLEHRRDHILKDWNYENGSIAVSVKQYI
jgi:hypothetical protein